MDKDFAIVKIGSSQYQVSKGDQLEVEKVEAEAGKKLVLTEVLLTTKKGKVTIGAPHVKGAKVEAKVLEHKKGRKVKTLKYRAKSRYRKRTGHRPMYTRIEIVKI